LEKPIPQLSQLDLTNLEEFPIAAHQIGKRPNK